MLPALQERRSNEMPVYNPVNLATLEKLAARTAELIEKLEQRSARAELIARRNLLVGLAILVGTIVLIALELT